MKVSTEVTAVLKNIVDKKPTNVEVNFNQAVMNKVKHSINTMRAEIGANLMNTVKK
jgi:hypothetical protein